LRRLAYFDKSSAAVLPAALAITVILVVAAMSWLLGIPGFQHDWDWPFTRAQAQQDAIFATHVWRPLGLGAAIGVPNGAMLSAVIWRIASWLGPLPALHLCEVAFFLCAAVGAFLFVRLLDPKACAILAAGAYCTSPVLYNKLFAGHIYYLIGIAALPWVAYFAVMSVDRRAFTYANAIACGIAAAVSAVQFQFAAFSLITILIVVLPRKATSVKKIAVFAIALVTLVALHLADYAVMLQPQSG